MLGSSRTPAAALLSSAMAASSATVPVVAPDEAVVPCRPSQTLTHAQALTPVAGAAMAVDTHAAVEGYNDGFCFACRHGSSPGLAPELTLIACSGCSLSFHLGCIFKPWVEPPDPTDTTGKPWICQFCVLDSSRSPATHENCKRLVQASVHSRGLCTRCGVRYDTLPHTSRVHECEATPLGLKLAQLVLRADVRVKKRRDIHAAAQPSVAETDAPTPGDTLSVHMHMPRPSDRELARCTIAPPGQQPKLPRFAGQSAAPAPASFDHDWLKVRAVLLAHARLLPGLGPGGPRARAYY